MTVKKVKRRGTKTSSFGVSKRENHNSDIFYSKKLYSKFKTDRKTKYREKKISKDILDDVHCLDSRNMSLLPASSIHLMITSPPYNAAKEYDEDLDLKEYRRLLKDVFNETYKKLVPGGRACINIANLGRKPYIPLHAYIIKDMLSLGYLMRGEIIWNKAASAGASTAWGSWKSASNPTLRDIHEYILVFSKKTFKRENKDKKNTISKDDFLECSKSIWSFPATSANKAEHPAPFPEELPYRLIQLYSFEGDVVLDPLCGSGNACIAAVKAKRHFVGFDIEEKYVEIAKRRIKKVADQKELEDFQSIS